MANGFSVTIDNAILNLLFRNTAYTPAATVYVALYTSDPTENDTGTEVSSVGTGYVRQAVTFGAPSAKTIKNSADVVFPQATASQGIVTHFAVRDGLTGGTLLAFGPLVNPKTVDVDDILKFLTNNLTISQTATP